MINSNHTDFSTLSFPLVQETLTSKSFKTLTIRPNSKEREALSPNLNFSGQTTNENSATSSNPQFVHQGHLIGTHLIARSRNQLVVFNSKSKKQNKRIFKHVSSIFAKVKQEIFGIIEQILISIELLIIHIDATVNFLISAFEKKWITTSDSFMMSIKKVKLFSSFLYMTKFNKAKQELSEKGMITQTPQPFKNNKVSQHNHTTRSHRENKPLTLVLDLDETLIHSSKIKPEKDFEPILIEQSVGTVAQIYVKKRPYLNLFLEKVRFMFCESCKLFIYVSFLSINYFYIIQN